MGQTQQRSRQKSDAEGKPIIPVCRGCGSQIDECVAKKSCQSDAKLHASNRVRLRCWKRRMKRWESGHKFLVSQETREKIGSKFRGRKLPQETKDKIGSKSKGRRHSQEAKDKISLKLTGNKLSQETKDKLRVRSTGRRHSQEAKEKMRFLATGLKRSQETKARMSVAFTGRKLSQETRRRMSVSRRELGSAGVMLSVNRERLVLKRMAALTKLA